MNETRPRRRRILVVGAVLALAMPLVSQVGAKVGTPGGRAPSAEEALSRSTEMRAIVVAERRQLESLYTAFDNAVDYRSALVVQAQIQTTKVDGQLALFRAQADYAQARGDTAQALEINKIIGNLLQDGSHGEPIARDQPSSARW